MAGVPSKARDPTAFDASETFLSFHLEATNPISQPKYRKVEKTTEEELVQGQNMTKYCAACISNTEFNEG